MEREFEEFEIDDWKVRFDEQPDTPVSPMRSNKEIIIRLCKDEVIKDREIYDLKEQLKSLGKWDKFKELKNELDDISCGALQDD